MAGLLGGFVYGVVAAFLTSRVPQFPLLLALVFLGQFLASLAFQRLPRYGVAGIQAGLALPFAYLATTGPEWGSFTTVRTRFAGLVVRSDEYLRAYDSFEMTSGSSEFDLRYGTVVIPVEFSKLRRIPSRQRQSRLQAVRAWQNGKAA